MCMRAYEREREGKPGEISHAFSLFFPIVSHCQSRLGGGAGFAFGGVNGWCHGSESNVAGEEPSKINVGLGLQRTVGRADSGGRFW